MRAIILAAFLLTLVAACGLTESAIHHPGEYDSQGIHFVTHGPGSCHVCDLYRRAEGYVVRLITTSGVGAGVVLTEDGKLATNAHVVGRSATLEVESSDGYRYVGTVIAIDVDLDLALLSVQSAGKVWEPPVLHAGASPPKGSEVYVVGHPLGLGWTVSRGIISGIWRDSEHTLIQTDAAISPGNSGGAMVDIHGHLIGIVTSKLVGEGVDNVAFARSTADLVEFLERVQKTSP
jgi:S1-C subfamily serine protease